VNGFRERFPSALRKTAFLSHVLDINSPVLVFDWPGDQGSTPRGYRRAQRVAGESGAELAQTLGLIIRQVQPERLWLVANSMGGEVVVHAFSILYREADLADAEVEIEDVVLTAPDVDRVEFNNQFKQEIAALARNLTVYVSSNDRALLISRVINRGRRLGEATLNPRNPDQSRHPGGCHAGESHSQFPQLQPGNSGIFRRFVSAACQHQHTFKSSHLPDPDTRRRSLLGLDPRSVAKKGEGSHDTHCLYG
jgi:hypothetical protein